MDPHDRARAHGADPIPTGPGSDRRRLLAAADGVRQDDQIGAGGHDVLGIQVPAALQSGDLDGETLREIVVFLAHYAGWPNAARLNTIVETEIAKSEKGQA